MEWDGEVEWGGEMGRWKKEGEWFSFVQLAAALDESTNQSTVQKFNNNKILIIILIT